MWAFALSSRWTYFCRCPSSQWGCFRQTSAEWQTVKGTWRHLQTFWSKWRIPPCSPVCIKTLQAVSPCFRKKFKKRNQFYWFVKGLPICWLEKGGGEANKTNLLLITLMEAQILPSPDILEVLIFFFLYVKSFHTLMEWREALSKNPLEVECRE